MGCVSSSEASVGMSLMEATEASWTHAHSKYELGEKIGKGSFAQVHIATQRHTKAEVAIKICQLEPSTTSANSLFATCLPPQERELKGPISELIAWKAVGTHANCVLLIDYFCDGYLVYMVMEKCDSSLFRYLQEHAVAYETCLGKAFEQILTGLSHMHSASVIHRDLKPENLHVRGSTVKICDFGLSAVVPESGFVTGIVGTAPYMAPEMLATEIYDEKADVWSLGVVAYLFLCGDSPYKASDGTAKKMKRSIIIGEAPDCSREWLSFKAISFLQQVLKRSPSERPTAKLALNSPFICNPDTENHPCIRDVIRKVQNAVAIDSNDIVSTTQTDIILNKLKNGELGNTSVKSYPNLNSKDIFSTPQLQGPKAMLANKVGDDSPPVWSESTTCSAS